MKRWVKGIIVIIFLNIAFISFLNYSYYSNIQFDSTHHDKQEKYQPDPHSSINTVENWSNFNWFGFFGYLSALLVIDAFTIRVIISSKMEGKKEYSIAYRLSDYYHDILENGLTEKQNLRIARETVMQYREFFDKLPASQVINWFEKDENERIRSYQLTKNHDMVDFHRTLLDLFRKYFADKYEELGIKS